MKFEIKKMESFFAHNNLSIEFDDIKSLDDYASAIEKLNDFEQEHIYRIQALEGEILEKRKMLSEKYDKLSFVQNQIDALNKMKKIEGFKRTFEGLEFSFNESLYAYLMDHKNIRCNPEDQKIERIIVPLSHEQGNEFAVYIDRTNNQIQRLCYVDNDQAQTERELSKEEALSVFFDITDIVGRDMKKDELLQNDTDKLMGFEMGTLLFGLDIYNKYRE